MNKEIDLPEKERELEIKSIVRELKDTKPEKFEQAYHHPDKKFRNRWRMAIAKEKIDIKKRKVMERYERAKVPKDRRCIKCKWVFDVKRDGRFRARLVACGYSQIPGVNFTESYAP